MVSPKSRVQSPKSSLLALLAVSVLSMGAAAVPPVVEAVKDGKVEAVRALLAKRADPNATESDGTTALHWAAHHDNLAAADLLIKAGANVGAANRYGATPLYLACVNGSAPIVERLLNAGADPNTAMPEGDTVLMTAARTGKAAVVRALLTRGARVNQSESWKGQTALMWAAAGNNAEAIDALVEAGADVRARTKYRTVPLFQTGGFGRRAERNSDVTRQAGFQALHFAVRAGGLEAVKALDRDYATTEAAVAGQARRSSTNAPQFTSAATSANTLPGAAGLSHATGVIHWLEFDAHPSVSHVSGTLADG